jgi:transglutaminase-like putative cysteine protease
MALAAPAMTSGYSAADEAPFARRLNVASTAITNEILETIATEDIAIRSEAAVTTFGQIVLPANEHFVDLDILEAATFKSDGRRLHVPADKILASGLPNAPQLGMFEADVKMRTIVFPDVAVGDTVHYTIRKRDRQRGIAGGFSQFYAASPAGRFDDVRITLDAPASLAIKDSSPGFTRIVEERDSRQLFSWVLRPQAYEADEPGTTSLIDRGPYVLFTSYADWDVIGRNFLAKAEPMSAPTPDVSRLAEDIIKGLVDRRDQAAAIFNWTSKNIRYFAIFLGQGGFVPHNAASVLNNRYGDCKDHVTLMRALLTAKGIESDYALISLQPSYSIFPVPTPDWFNHIILWLPEFDLYVDPTVSAATFTSLPDAVTDKPVLRMGSRGIVLARTPPSTADTNRLAITADVTLSPAGATKGSTAFAASGATGINLRMAMAQVALRGSDATAKDLLLKQGWRGTATIASDQNSDRAEPYIVTTTYDLSTAFFTEQGNNTPVPIGPRLDTPAWQIFNQALKRKLTHNFVCRAETYEQAIDFHFPEGRQLASIPQGVEMKSALATFEARYELTGQTLRIKRLLALRVPSQSCSPQTARDIAPLINAAAKEFNWRPQFVGKK